MRPRAVVVAAALGGWLTVALALFAFPDTEEPGRADAVVVLAGEKRRLPRGLELVRARVAPVLVVSADRRRPVERRVCAGRAGVRAICFRPDPYSTRGEARAIARLARSRGWRTLVVVTSSFHAHRARLIVERCFDGEVRMVASEVDRRWLPVYLATETVKLTVALTARRGC